MAANVAAKTHVINISGNNDVITENKLSKPLFWGLRNL